MERLSLNPNKALCSCIDCPDPCGLWEPYDVGITFGGSTRIPEDSLACEAEHQLVSEHFVSVHVCLRDIVLCFDFFFWLTVLFKKFITIHSCRGVQDGSNQCALCPRDTGYKTLKMVSGEAAKAGTSTLRLPGQEGTTHELGQFGSRSPTYVSRN